MIVVLQKKKLHETQGSQSKFHEIYIYICNIYLFIIIIIIIHS